MNNKYAWTLIALIGLPTIGWLVFTSEPTTTRSELADLKSPSNRAVPDDNSDTTLVSARPVIDRSDGYVGSDACRQCHQGQHQSWHASYHRTMTQPITPETAPAAIFDSRVEMLGQEFVFKRQGDEFLVTLNDPILNGKRVTRRLVLMTGSHHAHVFWYESGFDKTPAQLQVMYLIDRQRWIPRKSFFLRPPHLEKENELGRWNEICSNCHSTHPRMRPDENHLTWDTRVSDFGISCEACHGPGEAHIAYHRLDDSVRTGDTSSVTADSADVEQANVQADPSIPRSAVDPIVNPLELPADKQSDLCGQCHGMMMVSVDDAAELDEFYTHGRKFRPGDQLEQADFLRVVRASKEQQQSDTFRRFDAQPGAVVGHFWPDGEMRVTGRDYTGMIESKCFQQGELSCMSCHTMHQLDESLQDDWKDDQLISGMRGDAACLQCHPKYQQLGSEHTHHPIDSAGSRCMNCHMPHTVYGIQKTSRSHTISSPAVATTLETGRPNACNLCHLDHTLEQTANQLTEWYGQPKPELTEDQKSTAASVLHFLTGDAGQRAVQINAFQWPPAQEASGTDWLRFYFLLGMEDPYDAIRLMSERGYRTLPDAPSLEYDFLSTPQQWARVFGPQYQEIFSRRWRPNPALLINSDGRLDMRRLESLMSRRDHRPVYLQE